MNTVRRGRAWIEARAAEQFRAENDSKVMIKMVQSVFCTFPIYSFVKVRERNAMKEPTPIALSFLYGFVISVEACVKSREHNVSERYRQTLGMPYS